MIYEHLYNKSIAEEYTQEVLERIFKKKINKL